MKNLSPKLFLVIFIGIFLNACGGGGSGSSPTSVSTPQSTTYTVGGTVAGLTSGTLALKNNGGDVLSISANSTTFTFATPLADLSAYNVTVSTQPTGFSCFVNNGTGTIAGANITNVSISCSANWIGTKQLGASGGNTGGNSVTTDSSGNVYVAGITNRGLDGNSVSGSSDYFLTKYDASGVRQSTKQLGVSGQDTYGYSVAADGSGNVYIAGYTTGGLDGNTLTGFYDFFLTKYNSSGIKQYTKQLGVSGQDTFGYSAAVDGSGNVYIAGYTTGGLDGNSLTGVGDFFLTKYNSNGIKQYTKQMGVASRVTDARSVAVDTSGNVYVAGFTGGGLDGNALTGIRIIL